MLKLCGGTAQAGSSLRSIRAGPGSPGPSHHPSQGAVVRPSEGNQSQMQDWPGHAKTFWAVPLSFFGLEAGSGKTRPLTPSAITAHWCSLWGCYLKDPSCQLYCSIPSHQLYRFIPSHQLYYSILLPQAPRKAPRDVSSCLHPLFFFPKPVYRGRWLWRGRITFLGGDS